ncbi:Retrotransposon gag protein [Ceratocystis lukuohia]|uniref:Retrotransposon gag protein n=1 Tax=Ceratocystis lukuohia TaxID=2019550 RepID=A0ABR4M8Z2_9PEZI
MPTYQFSSEGSSIYESPTDHEDVPVEDVRTHSVPVEDTRKRTMQNTPAAALGCPLYNGNRALYRAWKNHMQGAMDYQDNLSDQKKITLILMSLTIQASEGISEKLTELRKKEGATEAEAWKVLDNRFEDPGHIDATRMKLNALKQKGDAYEVYVQDFYKLLQEARGQAWPEEIKIDAFRKGLDRKVTYYTLATAPGKTLEEEIKIYRQVYTNILRNKNLDKFSAYISSPNQHDEIPREYGDPMDIDSNYTQSHSTPRPKTTQNSSPGLPDDHKYRGRVAKWVSNEEMSRRRQANVCLRCARPKCWARVCPLKPARRPAPIHTQVNNTTVEEWNTPPVEETSVADDQGKA